MVSVIGINAWLNQQRGHHESRPAPSRKSGGLGSEPHTDDTKFYSSIGASSASDRVADQPSIPQRFELAGFLPSSPPGEADDLLPMNEPVMLRSPEDRDGVQTGRVGQDQPVELDRMEHAGLTDVGVRRSHNQDAFTCQPAHDAEQWQRVGHVFLVADGMGGHAVGEKASAKAVRDLPHTYFKHIDEGPIAAIRRAFLETNASIHAIGESNPEFRGLGTTATALFLRPDGAWVGHVGDSRVYRIRDGYLEQLTFDHSLSWALAQQHGVDPDDLPEIRRNVIIRSLGPDPLVQVDIEGPYRVEPGDIFILCSDGLSNPLTPEEIASVAIALPPAEACAFLVELANLRGGPDNITVIVVRVPHHETVSIETQILPKQNRNLFTWLKRRVQRGIDAWQARVPWPLSLLMLGVVQAIAFFIAIAENTLVAKLLFLSASTTIGVGLVGLFLQARLEKKRKRTPLPTPTKLNIYRRYPCQIDHRLLDKLAKLADSLYTQIVDRRLSIDEPQFRQLQQQARELLKRGEPVAAFHEIARSVRLLTQILHQQRNKEEVFRPKWDSASAK